LRISSVATGGDVLKAKARDVKVLAARLPLPEPPVAAAERERPAPATSGNKHKIF